MNGTDKYWFDVWSEFDDDFESCIEQICKIVWLFWSFLLFVEELNKFSSEFSFSLKRVFNFWIELLYDSKSSISSIIDSIWSRLIQSKKFSLFFSSSERDWKIRSRLISRSVSFLPRTNSNKNFVVFSLLLDDSFWWSSFFSSFNSWLKSWSKKIFIKSIAWVIACS